MCRLHLRNTNYPYNVSEVAPGVWRQNLIESGAYGL